MAVIPQWFSMPYCCFSCSGFHGNSLPLHVIQGLWDHVPCFNSTALHTQQQTTGTFGARKEHCFFSRHFIFVSGNPPPSQTKKSLKDRMHDMTWLCNQIWLPSNFHSEKFVINSKCHVFESSLNAWYDCAFGFKGRTSLIKRFVVFPVVEEAPHWERHSDHCVPGARSSPLHPKGHSLSLSARLHHRPSAQSLLGQHMLQVGAAAGRTGLNEFGGEKGKCWDESNGYKSYSFYTCVHAVVCLC